MENNVTYPQWKLIFQKTNPKYFTLILLGGLSVMVLIVLNNNNSCSIDYVIITNDISTYEQSLDPEYCENILEEIDLYNDQCEHPIEILDCG